MSKLCNMCNEEKPLSEFYKRGKNNPRLISRCKPCHREISKAYGKAHYNKEATAIRSLAWLVAHPGKTQEYTKRAYRKRLKTGTSIAGWLRQTYTGRPCMDCDGVFEWCSMDFDHRPEENKEFQIGRMSGYTTTPESIAKVENEITKCDIVCSNCHRVRTRDRHE